MNVVVHVRERMLQPLAALLAPLCTASLQSLPEEARQAAEVLILCVGRPRLLDTLALLLESRQVWVGGATRIARKQLHGVRGEEPLPQQSAEVMQSGVLPGALEEQEEVDMQNTVCLL